MSRNARTKPTGCSGQLPNGGRLCDDAGSQRLIISDWGDASIGNPLCTLTVLLTSMAFQRGVEAGAPEIMAVRDDYLARWEAFASAGELRKAAAIATRIGMIGRTLSWRNAIRSAPPHTVSEIADSVPSWLAEFVGTFEENHARKEQ